MISLVIYHIIKFLCICIIWSLIYFPYGLEPLSGTETVAVPRVPKTLLLSPFVGAFVDCHAVIHALRKEMLSNKI